ncbi:MAG: hypothetical protein V3V00_03430 [Saprospiraceae bacterium]
MQEKPLFVHLIDILWKWRKHLLIILVATAVLVSVVMLSKPNYFQSTTIFYPASTAIQKPVFTEAQRNINYYGDDHDVDRMLSIATSIDIKKEVIEGNDLRSHYGFGSENKDTEKLYKTFGKMYKVMKTEYDAIQIVFRDTNPNMAAKVTKFAREKVDQKTQNIIKSAQENVLKNAENSLKIIQNEINTLKEELKIERKKYGVYNTDSQAEAFAIMASKPGSMTNVQQKVNTYTEGISHVKSLEDQIEFTTQNLVNYQSNTYRLKSALESNISTMHVVQNANIPVSKAGPFRSLYVLGALLLIGMLSVLIILMLEAVSNNRSSKT